MLKLLIRVPEAAGMMSVMTIPNCVVPVVAMETTVPSTVSTTGLARSGSISWTVKVPSELRIASMLAASLAVGKQPAKVVCETQRA